MNPLHSSKNLEGCRQFEETLPACCREIIVGRLLFGHLDGLLMFIKRTESY